MNSEVFLEMLLSKLKDEKTDVINVGFSDKNYDFSGLSDGKTIICISSTGFQKNINRIASIKKINSLECIISLPIFREGDNLLIIIFDSNKHESNCLFIDESDSLIHKDDSTDWTYASEELIYSITKTYSEFTESDSSVIFDVNDIFSSVQEDDGLTFESAMPSQSEDDFDILSLKSDMVDATPKKQKIISKELTSDMLVLKSDIVDVDHKKQKVIPNDLADELLSLKQQQSSNEEFLKHDVKSVESPQNFNLSFLNDAMYYKKRQDPENLLYKDGERLIDGEVEFRRLKKIADLKNIYYKDDNDSILIATCKSCKSKLVFYNDDIMDFEGEVYIELSNISNMVSIDYLYEYLNSANGMNELLYFSKANSHITPGDIKNVKIPIPPLDVQKEIVKVSRESREFFKSIELLKKEFTSNILDYRHMRNSLNQFRGDIEFNDKNEITALSRSWRHVYKGLIWPLAISYLSATKGGFESVEKKDNYLVLFEFIAAFNTIILLSGLPNKVYEKNFSKIWDSNNPKEYHKMTFGNWVYLSKNLADVYRSNNFTTSLDEELFEKITDDKFLNILEKTNYLRNDESHGSHSNSYEAEKVIEKLDIYLEDIFDILEVYSDYKLIYVTGDITSAKQKYRHRVISLNGPCAQPIYDDIIFDTVLPGDSLYLYNPKNNKKLNLKETLIKFAPVEENKKRWALFIYYACDKNEYKARYRCFQSKEDDVIVNISSLKRDILH